jgi:hypothetical protein
MWQNCFSSFFQPIAPRIVVFWSFSLVSECNSVRGAYLTDDICVITKFGCSFLLETAPEV